MSALDARGLPTPGGGAHGGAGRAGARPSSTRAARSPRPLRAVVALLGALAVALPGGTIAAAPPARGAAAAAAAAAKKACGDAYEQTQAARKDGKLRAAHEAALVCAQDACAKFIKKDCAAWLPEIEASTPTIVFEGLDTDNKDTSAVKVRMDGKPLLEQLDGKAIEVDPGEHAFRYELDGSPPKEEHLILREGEKNRKVVISYYVAPPEPPPAPPSGPAPPPEGKPTSVYVFGGLGVVGLGTFGLFAALGLSQKGSLESSCAPACSAGDVSSVRTKLVIGDIGLAAGVASLGIATVLFLNAPSSSPAPKTGLRLDVGPARGGGMARVTGSF